jgi:hypothetical protein
VSAMRDCPAHGRRQALNICNSAGLPKSSLQRRNSRRFDRTSGSPSLPRVFPSMGKERCRQIFPQPCLLGAASALPLIDRMSCRIFNLNRILRKGRTNTTGVTNLLQSRSALYLKGPLQCRLFSDLFPTSSGTGRECFSQLGDGSRLRKTLCNIAARHHVWVSLGHVKHRLLTLAPETNV